MVIVHVSQDVIVVLGWICCNSSNIRAQVYYVITTANIMTYDNYNQWFRGRIQYPKLHSFSKLNFIRYFCSHKPCARYIAHPKIQQKIRFDSNLETSLRVNPEMLVIPQWWSSFLNIFQQKQNGSGLMGAHLNLLFWALVSKTRMLTLLFAGLSN